MSKKKIIQPVIKIEPSYPLWKIESSYPLWKRIWVLIKNIHIYLLWVCRVLNQNKDE